MHESIYFILSYHSLTHYELHTKESEAKRTPQSFESKLSAYPRNLLYSIFWLTSESVPDGLAMGSAKKKGADGI